MKRVIHLLFLLSVLVTGTAAFAQERNGELDSLRKREEEGTDTVIFTSKYIRYTNRALLRDSTVTFPIDTTLRNFQLYSPLYQVRNPSVSLGSTGLAARDLLYSPRKTIGFDAGFHALDRYLLTQDDIRYYRARSPFTQLYYVNGGLKEQVFQVTHTQNVKPGWNIGANYFRIGSEGYYRNQNADHLNAALFTWYESKNRRYNLIANGLFNTLKAGENGSLAADSANAAGERRDALRVKLGGNPADRSRQTWRQKGFLLSQSFFPGRIDSARSDSAGTKVLPTQRLSHTVSYSSMNYRYSKNEPDLYGAFPNDLVSDSVALTKDSTTVRHLTNEFGYSFFLRSRAVTFLKNELKLDLRLQHDLYWYDQQSERQPAIQPSARESFHNITARAGLGYRFSDRVSIQGNLEQVVQGRSRGDYLYEARTHFLLSRSLGRIVLGAYIQNRSPEEIFERVNYQYHRWEQSFAKSKVNNLSFAYENPAVRLAARAEYYRESNHLFFQETDSMQIRPEQFGRDLNLLKLSVSKHFGFGKFNLENYVAYQKTDFERILRTPELYTYNSFYYASRWFRVLDINLGFDVWYNTPFRAPAYAINVGQFYNDLEGQEFETFPVVDLFVKATLKRTNLFLKYDFANQGFPSGRFYTVNRYPMQDALLKLGVKWNFYN